VTARQSEASDSERSEASARGAKPLLRAGSEGGRFDSPPVHRIYIQEMLFKKNGVSAKRLRIVEPPAFTPPNIVQPVSQRIGIISPDNVCFIFGVATML